MARQPAGSRVETALAGTYGYEAVDTCATDGSCQAACPVGIDTGALMKRLRHARHTPREERARRSRHAAFGAAEAAARAAVAAAHRTRRVAGDGLPRAVTGALRRVVRADLVPEWLPELPGAAAALPLPPAATGRPRCTTRLREPDLRRPAGQRGPVPAGGRHGPVRAGRAPVWIPDDVRAPAAPSSGPPRVRGGRRAGGRPDRGGRLGLDRGRAAPAGRRRVVVRPRLRGGTRRRTSATATGSCTGS